MFKKIVNIMLMIFALSLAGAVQAERVSDSDAARVLGNCLLADDAESSGSYANGSVCCSKDLGYCIECNDNELCKMTTYRLSPLNGERLDNTVIRPQGNAVIAPAPKPPSLRDQVKPAQSAATAPAKIVNPEKAPTVKPIKQYQQIKAPAAADKAMTK